MLIRDRFGITAPLAEMVSRHPKMVSSEPRSSVQAGAHDGTDRAPRRRGTTANVLYGQSFSEPAWAKQDKRGRLMLLGDRRPALAAGIPTAPAYAGQTLKIGCDRPPGLALICRMYRSDSLIFRFSSAMAFWVPPALLGTGDFANREPGGLQRLQGVPVPPELDPVPGDVAIAVSTHVDLLIRGRA